MMHKCRLEARGSRVTRSFEMWSVSAMKEGSIL